MEFLQKIAEMDPETLVGVFFLITTVAGSITTAAANTRKKLKDNAVQLIGHAEEEFADQEQAGAAKHAYAVEKLQQLVPKALRPFFPVKLLEQMVDSSFDAVSQYARAQTAAQGSAPVSAGAEGDRGETALQGGGSGAAAVEQPSGGWGAFPREKGGESTVRVFTVRGRNGILFRVRYGVCRRRNRTEHSAEWDREVPVDQERW